MKVTVDRRSKASKLIIILLLLMEQFGAGADTEAEM